MSRPISIPKLTHHKASGKAVVRLSGVDVYCGLFGTDQIQRRICWWTVRCGSESLIYITPGQYGGCLGAKYDPLVVNADPNAPNFRLPNIGLEDDMTPIRLDERRALLGRLDGTAQRAAHTIPADHGVNQGNAFSMMSSPEVQRAFDLSREPDRVRDRYGRHRWGSRTCWHGGWSRRVCASSRR